ncbi:MAG: RNA 3'-terminal phosphate cyclase [Gemmataceae bacterium]
MLELDGSMGEGGGQILRTSLALSLITQKSFRLTRIRAGREKPGLQPQHLASVRAAATIGNANIRGDAVGSRELLFEPGPVVSGKYRFAIGTAGATGLVLHTVYLPLAWKTGQPSEITLEGGTHVKTSPCFHFLDTTWRAYLAQLGLHVKLKMTRPGFYPRGGGVVEAIIQPVDLLPGGVNLNRDWPIKTAGGFAAVARLPDHIALRMIRRVVVRLAARGLDVHLDPQEWEGGPGAVLAVTLPGPKPTMFTAIGARGKPAEGVADELLDEVEAWFDGGAQVDPHSADQIVLPLALADEPSEYRVSAVTRHLTTNIKVIRHFLDREISVEGEEGSTGVVRVGVGGL